MHGAYMSKCLNEVKRMQVDLNHIVDCVQMVGARSLCKLGGWVASKIRVPWNVFT